MFEQSSNNFLKVMGDPQYIPTGTEKIISIKDCFIYHDNSNEAWIGYKIITTQQEMHFFIDNEEIDDTYEDYAVNIKPLKNENGFHPSISDLIGNEIKLVTWDGGIMTEDVNDYTDIKRDAFYIKTDKHAFNVIIWNQHNGFGKRTYKVKYGNYEYSDEL